MIAPRPQIAQINPELAAEYKKRIDEKNAELDSKFDMKRARPLPPLVMPYDNLPDMYSRADLCYNAIAYVMQPIPGWVQTGAQCDDTHVSATFKINYGTLAGFYDVATDLMPGAFVSEKSESELFVRAKLPELPLGASLDERDPETIVRAVNTEFQKIKTPVETNITVDVVGDATRSENVNVIEIAARSKLTPPEFMRLFDDLRGVFMTRAAWDAMSRTWNYEVIIYAK
jgi:hypothetical protein